MIIMEHIRDGVGRKIVPDAWGIETSVRLPGLWEVTYYA